MTKPPLMSPCPVREVHVERGDSGQRIDNFLRSALKGVPRSRIYRILRRGEVRVNRKRTRQHYRLKAGDVVRIPPLRVGWPARERLPPPSLLDTLEAAILYEDENLMALNKPAGLAVHGGSGHGLGLIEGLRRLRPRHGFLDLVHRLDLDTSGLLLVAKRRCALVDLHRAFREGHVDKRYRLLVKGCFRRVRSIDDALLKGVSRSGERVVRASKAGQPARTDFFPIAWNPHCSLLEARPRTGRTHQIRVHAANAGHPVGGDQRYGDRDFNRQLHGAGLRRMFLHAHFLGLTDRTAGRPLRLEAPLPSELDRILGVLELDESGICGPGAGRA